MSHSTLSSETEVSPVIQTTPLQLQMEHPQDDDVVQPPSPSKGTLKLQDYIEPLVQLTLTLSIQQTINLHLSTQFCSNLLQNDHPCQSSPSSSTDRLEGVPSYPLYKYLASALCESILSGSVPRMCADMPMISEDPLVKQKEDDWNKIIHEKGSDLIRMLETVDFELHVQEPFLSQLKDGQKTVEGRCAGGDYNRIESGSMLLFNKCLLLQVQDVHPYASFSEMLAAEGLTKVLPGVETIKEGTQIYRNFYSEEKEMSNGVLGIHLAQPISQLYDPLATILAVLSYDGIQRLLGIAHTVGTIPDALPLPKSALLSAFSLPHNPDVKSSVLSDGARALAKHVNRSNGKFWGSFTGNESQKNMLALKVISHLMSHCCWLNVHVVPPHGAVFEIRVQDGYGARWSLDTTKFIGFLEPYMEDGHSRGWKH